MKGPDKLNDNKIIASTLRRLKRLGVDKGDMFSVVLELAKEIEYYRDIIDGLQEKNFKPEENQKIYFLCDRRACKCCDPLCGYTSDIEHAKNFKRIGVIIREKKENMATRGL